MNLKNFIH